MRKKVNWQRCKDYMTDIDRIDPIHNNVESYQLGYLHGQHQESQWISPNQPSPVVSSVGAWWAHGSGSSCAVCQLLSQIILSWRNYIISRCDQLKYKISYWLHVCRNCKIETTLHSVHNTVFLHAGEQEISPFNYCFCAKTTCTNLPTCLAQR